MPVCGGTCSHHRILQSAAPPSGVSPTRRDVMAAAVAAGGLSLMGMSAPRRAAAPGIVDFHHHVYPPAYVQALREAGQPGSSFDWSPQKSLEDMDAAGVAIAITSFTPPQLSFLAADKAAPIAREMNEFAAGLSADYPGRFGSFAVLPIGDRDLSLVEAAYALDSLHADGIGLMTSYGDKWLGHPEFWPLFEELNRRKANVYVHPTGWNCCADLVPGKPDIISLITDIGADTTRTITSLIFSGVSRRFSDITFIFCHGGGTLTAVAERLQIQLVDLPFFKDEINREIVDAELDRFYYDTAQIANAVTIEALVELVPVSQVVFGTDFPVRTASEHVEGLQRAFGPEELRAIYRDNAARILPRLRAP